MDQYNAGRAQANSGLVAGSKTARDDSDSGPFARGGNFEEASAAAEEEAVPQKGVVGAAKKPPARGVDRAMELKTRTAASTKRDPSKTASSMRQAYQQGALPLRVVYRSVRGVSQRCVGWLVDDISRLDVRYYLPLFVNGFSDRTEPVGFLAVEAALDLLQVAAEQHRVLALAPLVSAPLKAALRSAHSQTAERALTFLAAFAQCDSNASSKRGLSLVGRTLPLQSLAAAVGTAATNHPGLAKHANVVFDLLQKHGGPGALQALKSGFPQRAQVLQ